MDRKALGQHRLKEVLGQKVVDKVAQFSRVSPDFANYIIEHAYGDLYARKGFNDKLREMSAVACLIGQGNTGMPLKSHLQGMVNVGWTKDEILELIIFLTGYAGFPSCVDAINIIMEMEI